MNPTQITGCQLWLDGADQSSLTLSGVNVTGWSDKSGNSHNAISVSTPTYSNNSITITPGNFIKAPMPAQTFINAFQAFIVYKSLGAAGATNDAVITRGNSTSNPNLANPLDMQASEFFIGQTNEVYIKNDYNCYNTNKSVFNLNINQVTQETESFSTFSNGLQAAGQYLSRGPPGTWTKSDDGDTVVIGGRVDNASSMHGIYYEVLIYNRVLSPNERQMVEGYLAWKWQLQSQLPALHPFLNGPPVYNQQLPPLKLMLKASTYNGTGAWLDESGNNANATLEQGLISINADNNGVVLNGATSWTFPPLNIGNAWTVNVWFKQTGPSVYNVGNYPFAHLITQIYNGTTSANLTIGETDLAATFSGGILYLSSWFRGNNITLQQNAWTNIQVTYDGTNMVTYVDGALLGSVALATTSINNGGAYLIGRRWDGNCFMVGEVGEIRIYNYAINQSKVTADHNESVANFPKPPLVLLKALTYSGSGTWLDASGQGKNATLEAGTIAKNAEGNGIILDGSTSWTFPALNIGNAWTVNVWFKRTADFSSIDAACIISQIFEGDGMNIYIGNTYGFLNCGFVTSSAAWALGSQITLTNNVWTNIQATWDGASIKTYINGVLIGTATSSAVDNNSGLGYRIGGSINGDKYVTGIIGEIRMYGYALTQAQVTRDYNESVETFYESPLVLLKASSYSGSGAWLDASGQGKNATLENGVIAKNAAGNGIVLNGSTSWTFPNVAVGNRWTANVWVKNTSNSQPSYSSYLTQIQNGGSINIMIGNWDGVMTPAFNVGYYNWYRSPNTISLVTNKWTNIQVTWDGTNMKTYVDSTILGTYTPGSQSFDNNTSYRIGRRWDNADYMIGEIGEVRIYGYALTQAQVTRDYNQSLGTFPFTPTDITGCQLWLDGKDPAATGSAPSNSAIITTWSDKSGNSNNGSIFGSGTATMSNDGIIFNGGTCYTCPYTSAPTTETIFIIVRTAAVGQYNAADLVNGTVHGNRQFQLNGYSQTININAIGTGGPAGTINFPVGSTFIYDLTYNPSNTNAYLNGVTDVNNASSISYNSNTYTCIGATIYNGNLVNGLNGIISEVVIYNFSLGTSDRQKVEGYLAWKWSLQSLLPSNHPYKNSAP